MSRRLFALLAALVLCTAGIAYAASGAKKLSATLSAKKEVGGKGPSGARGTFSATLKGTKLCYKLTTSGLSKPLAAHIHKGTSKQNGNIVVDLQPKFSGGKASRCVTVAAAVSKPILKKPAGYYVNVHTKKQPNGAIRGQVSVH